MPASTENNIIEDMLVLIKFAREKAEEHAGSSIEESMEDIICKLCRILHKLLTAPLNGRLFITPPQTYTDPDEQNASLQKHLVSAWHGVAHD